MCGPTTSKFLFLARIVWCLFPGLSLYALLSFFPHMVNMHLTCAHSILMDVNQTIKALNLMSNMIGTM